MNNIIKRMSAGTWITCVSAVLALVAVIVYGVNVSGAGYFHNASVNNLVLFNILAIVALVGVWAVGVFVKPSTVTELISGLLQIAVPVLLALCFINLVAARVEGLGFIFFSNPDVIQEVQTPANMASATGTIANMVCLGVAMVTSIVAAFTNTAKKA